LSRDEVLTYGQVAALLRTSPIEAMAWLQIFGLVSDGASVPRSTVLVAAAKLGLAIGPEASKREPNEQIDVQQAIDKDSDPGRKFLRRLLDKMDRHGYWSPSTTRTTSLRHGFDEPETGWVKPAVEILLKAGWLEIGELLRRERSEPPVGLGRAYREAITSFIRTGQTDVTEVGEFIQEHR